MHDLLQNAELSKKAKGKELESKDTNGSYPGYSTKLNDHDDGSTQKQLAYQGSSGSVLTSETYQYLSSEEVLESLRCDVPTSLSGVPGEPNSQTGPDVECMKELWNNLLETETSDNTTDVIQMYELQCKFRRKMRQQAKLTQYSLLYQTNDEEDED